MKRFIFICFIASCELLYGQDPLVSVHDFSGIFDEEQLGDLESLIIEVKDQKGWEVILLVGTNGFPQLPGNIPPWIEVHANSIVFFVPVEEETGSSILNYSEGVHVSPLKVEKIENFIIPPLLESGNIYDACYFGIRELLEVDLFISYDSTAYDNGDVIVLESNEESIELVLTFFDNDSIPTVVTPGSIYWTGAETVSDNTAYSVSTPFTEEASQVIVSYKGAINDIFMDEEISVDLARLRFKFLIPESDSDRIYGYDECNETDIEKERCTESEKGIHVSLNRKPGTTIIYGKTRGLENIIFESSDPNIAILDNNSPIEIRRGVYSFSIDSETTVDGVTEILAKSKETGEVLDRFFVHVYKENILENVDVFRIYDSRVTPSSTLTSINLDKIEDVANKYLKSLVVKSNFNSTILEDFAFDENQNNQLDEYVEDPEYSETYLINSVFDHRAEDIYLFPVSTINEAYKVTSIENSNTLNKIYVNTMVNLEVGSTLKLEEVNGNNSQEIVVQSKHDEAPVKKSVLFLNNPLQQSFPVSDGVYLVRNVEKQVVKILNNKTKLELINDLGVDETGEAQIGECGSQPEQRENIIISEIKEEGYKINAYLQESFSGSYTNTCLFYMKKIILNSSLESGKRRIAFDNSISDETLMFSQILSGNSSYSYFLENANMAKEKLDIVQHLAFNTTRSYIIPNSNLIGNISTNKSYHLIKSQETGAHSLRSSYRDRQNPGFEDRAIYVKEGNRSGDVDIDQMIGAQYAHEQGHNLNLFDVDNTSNVMHYSTLSTPTGSPLLINRVLISDATFFFKKLRTVITTTNEPNGLSEGQWNRIERF